jgi:hypothetical protein
MKRALLATCVLLAMATSFACGDDDDEVIINPSETPTASPTATNSPTSPASTMRDVPSAVSHPELLAELATNREKWDAAEVVSYQYDFELFCFCPPLNHAVTIVVSNGQMVSMTSLSGAPIEGFVEEILSRYPTIDAIFDRTRAEIERSDEISIVYDDDYGFPKNVRSEGSSYAIDDESSTSVTNFQVLP